MYVCNCILNYKCMFDVHGHCPKRNCLIQGPCFFALTLDMTVNTHWLCGMAMHRADVLTSRTIQQFQLITNMNSIKQARKCSLLFHKISAQFSFLIFVCVFSYFSLVQMLPSCSSCSASHFYGPRIVRTKMVSRHLREQLRYGQIQL